MIKVLLVDDDIDLLEMVCLMLQTSHLNAYCISKGKEVFPSLENDSPDIIVMDIFLGDSDGRDLCLQIKNKEKYSTLPVLLYSAGHIADSTLVECRADAFLQKPFDMMTLISRIKALTTAA